MLQREKAVDHATALTYGRHLCVDCSCAQRVVMYGKHLCHDCLCAQKVRGLRKRRHRGRTRQKEKRMVASLAICWAGLSRKIHVLYCLLAQSLGSSRAHEELHVHEKLHARKDFCMHTTICMYTKIYMTLGCAVPVFHTGPAHPDDRIHIIFSTSCSHFQQWQAEVVAYCITISAKRNAYAPWH